MKVIRVIVIIGEAILKASPLLEFIQLKIEERKQRKLQEEIANNLAAQQQISNTIHNNLTNETK